MQVCDDTGCTDFGSRRSIGNRRANEVRVEYEIQAGSVSPDKIKEAVSDPNFTDSFEQVMMEIHRYPVLAQCLDCEQLKVEEEKKEEEEEKSGGIISDISEALEEATGLSAGAIAGIAIGSAAGLGALAAGASVLSKKKSPPPAAAPSAPAMWSPSGDLQSTWAAGATATAMEAGRVGGGGPGVDGWQQPAQPAISPSVPVVQNSNPTQTLFCSGCGAPMVMGAQFCGTCGRKAG